MIEIKGNYIMLTTSNGGAKFAVPLGVYAFEDHNPGSYIYGIPHNDGYGLSVEEHCDDIMAAIERHSKPKTVSDEVYEKLKNLIRSTTKYASEHGFTDHLLLIMTNDIIEIVKGTE